MTKLDAIGIGDTEQKHVVICKPVGADKPVVSLLWRASGPRGRPLPKIGDILPVPGYTVEVVRIDAPGSMDTDDYPGSTLIVKPEGGAW